MRLVRCILALAVVAALGVALPGELAACSPMPGFPPEWARALNQLAAYRLAVAAAALALAASACTTPPPVQGEFALKDHRIRVHPDGRIEIVVERESAK